MPRSTPALCLISAALLPAGASLAQPASFHALGGLQPTSIFSVGFRASVTGQAVDGITTDATGFVAFRWTAIDGMVSLGRLSPTGDSAAFALSARGDVVVGSADIPAGTDAFRWTAATGMVSLGDLPGGPHNAAAYCCSSDASIIAGLADGVLLPSEEFGQSQAFRWTQPTGMVGLGFLRPGDTFSDIEAMNPAGTILVGASGLEGSRLEAVRWTQATGMTGLGDLPGGRLFSIAYGLTPDGSVIVGQGESASGPEAFRWTLATGMVGLGDLPGGAFDSAVGGVSDDGSRIVGYASTAAADREAILWTPAAGMRRITDILQNDFHLNLAGWVLREAGYISPDGRIIVGDGYDPDGNRQAWVAEIPTGTTCTADFNHDGIVNSQDFFDFLNAFFSCS